jgi:glycosyltransferase involved in cell wall biosynthesis
LSKKILLVIHTPPPFGGGEIQAQYVKDYFGKKGNYFIYDYSRKNHSRTNWDSSFDIKAILAGINWDIKVIFLLFWLRPDKIYFTLPKSFMAFMRNAVIIPFAKLLNVKVLGELPGTSFLFLEKEQGFKYRLGLFFMRKIDEIRFLSPRISALHKSFGLKKHMIIENGILPEKMVVLNPDVLNKHVLTLLYVGSIERSKGIFNSLHALKICLDKGCQLHFHIIGYWPKAQEEKEALLFIHENKLERSITFHGILVGSPKWEIFKNCAVLVHPTFWDGVPLTILEALAIGMPVISTNVGGIPDTINDGVNGIILSENTAEILSSAILSFYNNRALLSDISAINKALFIERFELSIFLNNMEKWFEE